MQVVLTCHEFHQWSLQTHLSGSQNLSKMEESQWLVWKAALGGIGIFGMDCLSSQSLVLMFKNEYCKSKCSHMHTVCLFFPSKPSALLIKGRELFSALRSSTLNHYSKLFSSRRNVQLQYRGRRKPENTEGTLVSGILQLRRDEPEVLVLMQWISFSLTCLRHCSNICVRLSC